MGAHPGYFRYTRKTKSKKTAKPRTIKVVGESADDNAVATTTPDALHAKANKKSKATAKTLGIRSTWCGTTAAG